MGEHLTEIHRCYLEDGRVYQIRSRNLMVGVWRASTQGFIGIREKFDRQFLFEEFHYDNGPPHGTARATKALDVRAVIPDAYWSEGGDDLHRLLMPLHLAARAEWLAERQAAELEAESLAYRPMTLAESKRREALDDVRRWHRAAVDAAGVDDRQGVHAEFIRRMEAAIRENPVNQP